MIRYVTATILWSGLFLAPAALANERQQVSPIWGEGDVGFPATSAYQMVGLDFDQETPGIELPDEELFACGIVAEGGGMIRIRYVTRIQFRDPSDGSVVYGTDNLMVRSQPFPDPFDPANRDMDDNLLYAYLTSFGDVTSQLQSAVLLEADPFETLCEQETFPAFSLFGVSMATTSSPARGASRTLIIADTLTGEYALKGDPLNPFWDGANPLEGIGTAKYWAIEASVGAVDKGTVVSSKAFNLQSDILEATPDWRLDFELSFVGDLLGTGDDVARIVEVNNTVTPGILLRRIRHFDVRTGGLVGSVVQYPIGD